jgi:uncharacterized protein (DUF885 family)
MLMRRKLAFLLLLGLVFASPLPVHSAAAGASAELADLLNDHDEADRRLYPSAAIQQGDDRDLDRYEDDLTERHLAERRRVNDEERARLSRIDRAALSEQEQLTYDIFAWNLDDERGELAPNIAHALQWMPLNQFFGSHLSFAREMQWRSDYPFNQTRDYERAIRRMQGFADWIDQAIAKMREGKRFGITQPSIVIERMIPQVAALAEPRVDDSLFLGPVRNIPANISEPDRTRIAGEYRKAVAEVLLPSYRRLLSFLRDDYLPGARRAPGLAAIPTGREFYLYLVRSHTTEELTPEAIHAIGQAEILRLTREMERAKAEAGYSGTLAEFRNFLRTDPRFVFPDENAMLAEFKRIDSEVAAGSERLFGIMPKAGLEFRLLETYSAPSKAAAEYSAPSADGRRPGIVYLNSFDLKSRPTYAAESLALHEGRPGHHMQASLAVENTGLPRFRRYGAPAAFVEGWALYAESLGDELGLYADPYKKFGQLSFEAWRAARLVIDTGIHWYGWTREEAIAYLMANTAMAEADAVAEVERYIALPGQALSYKIGERKFLELRGRAEAELGAKFDIRRFHDAVLKDGAMPLPILDAKITRWIAVEKAG